MARESHKAGSDILRVVVVVLEATRARSTYGDEAMGFKRSATFAGVLHGRFNAGYTDRILIDGGIFTINHVSMTAAGMVRIVYRMRTRHKEFEPGAEIVAVLET